MQHHRRGRWKNGQTLTTRAIVIATGASAGAGYSRLQAIRYYASDTIWALTERPQRLIVLAVVGRLRINELSRDWTAMSRRLSAAICCRVKMPMPWRWLKRHYKPMA